MPQIELTDEEIKRLLYFVGEYKPKISEKDYRLTNDYRLGVNIYQKLEASRRTLAQIIAEEMRELQRRIFGPNDIDAVLFRIRCWARRLEQAEDATP